MMRPSEAGHTGVGDFALMLAAFVAAFVVVVSQPGPAAAGRTHTVLSSAYCFGKYTKSERRIRFGYVATSPGKYRLGTYLRLVHPRSITDPVTGHKRSVLRVMDRGYSPLDIWFTPGPGVRESGCAWGRRKVTYRIIGWAPTNRSRRWGHGR